MWIDARIDEAVAESHSAPVTRLAGGGHRVGPSRAAIILIFIVQRERDRLAHSPGPDRKYFERGIVTDHRRMDHAVDELAADARV